MPRLLREILAFLEVRHSEITLKYFWINPEFSLFTITFRLLDKIFSLFFFTVWTHLWFLECQSLKTSIYYTNIHFGWIHFQGRPTCPRPCTWDCAVRGWGAAGCVLLHAGQRELPARVCLPVPSPSVMLRLEHVFLFFSPGRPLTSTCLWWETSQTQMPWSLHCVSNVKRWHLPACEGSRSLRLSVKWVPIPPFVRFCLHEMSGGDRSMETDGQLVKVPGGAGRGAGFGQKWGMTNSGYRFLLRSRN